LTDLSVTLISQCLKESHEAVTSQLFDKFWRNLHRLSRPLFHLSSHI
jgi:hypothetical protein